MLVVVTVLNPASIAAVQYGHPEEVLAAALSVGAVALALRDRDLAAAVALGLAIASKQWAILAVAPTLLALPAGSWLRLLCISGAIAAGATLPLLAADPAGFGNVSRGAVNGGVLVTRSTWWFFAAAPDKVHLQLPAGYPMSFTLYRLPSWLGQVTHPLIVGLAVPLAILVYWRNRTREAALPLIAILFPAPLRARPDGQCVLPRASAPRTARVRGALHEPAGARRDDSDRGPALAHVRCR